MLYNGFFIISNLLFTINWWDNEEYNVWMSQIMIWCEDKIRIRYCIKYFYSTE